MISFKSCKKLFILSSCRFLLRFILIISISAGSKSPAMLGSPKVRIIPKFGDVLTFISAFRWTDQCQAPVTSVRYPQNLIRCSASSLISHDQLTLNAPKFSCPRAYYRMRRSLAVCSTSIDSKSEPLKVQSKTQILIGAVPQDLSDEDMRPCVLMAG